MVDIDCVSFRGYGHLCYEPMINMDIDLMDKLNDARRARVLLEGLLKERMEYLINRLVDDYRGDKFNPDKALGAIAEIAGMQEQIDKLTRIITGAM